LGDPKDYLHFHLLTKEGHYRPMRGTHANIFVQDSGFMQIMGCTLVLDLGYRTGIIVWLELWKIIFNLQIMWFTTHPTPHKSYTKVLFSFSAF